MNHSQNILSFLQRNGPSLPAQVAKHSGLSLLLASAHLAELSSSGKVRISSLKIGGSPLYLLPEHGHMLDNFLDNFNDKEKKALVLLQEHKVLRDTDLGPLSRVSLRQAKDFAIPIHVNQGESKELFWRWHTLSKEETQEAVTTILKPIEQKKPQKEEVQPESPTKQAIQEKQPETKPEETPKPVEPPQEPKPIPEKKIEKPPKEHPQTSSDENETSDTPKKKPRTFSGKVSYFFEQNNIEIIEEKTIRKDKDMEYIVSILSPLGPLQLFCKAKDKKRISDSDLSNVFVQGQLKKLPAVLITQGELSKKAQELLDSELQGVTVKVI